MNFMSCSSLVYLLTISMWNFTFQHTHSQLGQFSIEMLIPGPVYTVLYTMFCTYYELKSSSKKYESIYPYSEF
jgi:hypothetical protein